MCLAVMRSPFQNCKSQKYDLQRDIKRLKRESDVLAEVVHMYFYSMY